MLSRPGARLVRRRQVLDFTAGAPHLPPRSSAWPVAAAALARPLRSVHCVDLAPGAPPVVALTWDDGPHPEHTPRVLDELAAAGARATFFMLVEAAEAHPSVVARVVEEGHEVALHGIDHRRLSALPPLRAAALVREGRRRLEDVAGTPVTLFRPPYGAQSPGQVLLTRLSGLTLVIWSAWASDWEDVDEATLTDRALAALHPGAVLLLHDAYGEGGVDPSKREPSFSRQRVARAVLEGLADRGIGTATVGELLARHPAVTTLWL